MLEQTFLFLPGVQESTEKRLWDQGIVDWNTLLLTDAIPGISKERLLFWKHRLRQAQRLLETNQGPTALARLLGTRHKWRCADHLLDEPRFIDIETSLHCQNITVIGISDGEFYQAFVAGVNLDQYHLRRALEGATSLITFNGSSFDIPMIERHFPGILPDIPHLDLRHICSQANLRGGLKKIEQHLGISRAAAIRDTDGVDAVLLWEQHRQGNAEALRDLIDYNAADVLNLHTLIHLVIPALWNHCRQGKALPFPPLQITTYQ